MPWVTMLMLSVFTKYDPNRTGLCYDYHKIYVCVIHKWCLCACFVILAIIVFEYVWNESSDSHMKRFLRKKVPIVPWLSLSYSETCLRQNLYKTESSWLPVSIIQSANQSAASRRSRFDLGWQAICPNKTTGCCCCRSDHDGN